VKDAGDRTLTLGVILAGLIIAALTWFLAINPKLSSAQSARDEAIAQLDQNFRLQQELDKRTLDAESMPDFIREIQYIRDLLPPAEDVTEIRRLVNEIASDAGLLVQEDRVVPAEPILGGLSLAAVMDVVGLTSEIEGLTFSALSGVQYSLDIEGPVDKVIQVVEALSASDHRFVLVTSLTIIPSDSDNPGAVWATIGIIFFTLDSGNPDITIRPPERAWPGTEEGEPAESINNVFEPIVEPRPG